MPISRPIIVAALAALLAVIGWGVYDYLRHPPVPLTAASAEALTQEHARVSAEATSIAMEGAQLSTGAQLPEPPVSSGEVDGRGPAAPAAPVAPPPPAPPVAPAPLVAPVDLGRWAALTAALFAPFALGAWPLWRRARRFRYA